MDFTADILRSLLSYDEESGEFVWLITSGKAVKGSVAGRIAKNGYLAIGIDGRRYYAHRLAWLYVHGKWPAADIDHRDCNRTNNRLTNLREATRTENCGNSQMRRNNTSGLKGAFWRPKEKTWQAKIVHSHKTYSLGCFKTAEEAHEAYMKAARRLHGQFARAA